MDDEHVHPSNTSVLLRDVIAIEAWLQEHALHLVTPGPHRTALDLTSLEPQRPADAVLEHADGTPVAELVVLPLLEMTHSAAVLHAPSAATDGRLLLLGPHTSSRGSAVLRNAGIHHIDGAGNAWLRLPGVVVDIRGRPSPRPASPRGSSQAHLFSPSRASVVCALSSWPELVEAPVRTIAASARVSVGLAQDTLKMLEAAGHLTTWPTRGLERIPQLIDRWAAAFPAALGSPARTRGYHAESLDVEAADAGVVRLSGEATAPGIRGLSAVVYTDESSIRLAMRNRWRTDREPNIFVRSLFWREPDEADASSLMGVAPPLVVYADLLASGEGRQRETARAMREADGGLRAR